MANSLTVKKMNRGHVLKQLVMNEGISRADLAKSLGLTKMTISNIVSELIEKDLIVEQEKMILGEPHKNPIRLNLSEKCPKIIGIQIQRKYCKAVLCDFRLNMIDSAEIRFQKVNLHVLKESLLQLIDRMIEKGNILGIGIGAIGPLDIENGVICNPPNFGDVKNFPVVEFIQKKYHLPVVMEHHYNCAALAESYWGMGSGISNFIYLGITNGVSMGGVVDGKLYSDFLHTVTEIGHMSIKYNGRSCRCGNRGCLERYISSDVMEEELRRLTGLDLSYREFCEMTDNQQVVDYFYKEMDYLLVALITITNIFKPARIIIGDDGKYLPDSCIAYLEEEVKKRSLYKQWWNVEIRKTGVNKDLLLASPAIGVIEKVFKGDLLFE